MKRAFPWNEQVDVISSDDSSSSNPEVEVDNGPVDKQSTDMTIDQPACLEPPEDIVIRRAEMYQEYMKQIPIPALRGSLIPFDTWMGLARSMKQLYAQPLHYLTNVLVKQWDQLRVGTKDENKSLDSIIHPVKAEASIWLIEEVHRQTTSPLHVAKLWLSDPMHYAFVDSTIPTYMKDAPLAL